MFPYYTAEFTAVGAPAEEPGKSVVRSYSLLLFRIFWLFLYLSLKQISILKDNVVPDSNYHASVPAL